jgi:hypothetical protein
MNAINDVWDDSTSLGIYNCRPVRGGTTRSIHSEGRAIDIGFPVLENEHGFEYANPLGHQLLKVLLKNAWGLGLQAIIWDRRWYSRSYPTGRDYNGVNPHIDHLHIEQAWNGALNLSLSTAYDLVGDMAFTPEQEQILKELADIIDEENSNGSVMRYIIRMIRAAR